MRVVLGFGRRSPYYCGPCRINGVPIIETRPWVKGFKLQENFTCQKPRQTERLPGPAVQDCKLYTIVLTSNFSEKVSSSVQYRTTGVAM